MEPIRKFQNLERRYREHVGRLLAPTRLGVSRSKHQPAGCYNGSRKQQILIWLKEDEVDFDKALSHRFLDWRYERSTEIQPELMGTSKMKTKIAKSSDVIVHNNAPLAGGPLTRRMPALIILAATLIICGMPAAARRSLVTQVMPAKGERHQKLLPDCTSASAGAQVTRADQSASCHCAGPDVSPARRSITGRVDFAPQCQEGLTELHDIPTGHLLSRYCAGSKQLRHFHVIVT
ncbi:hypothetical protein ACVOMV_26100 (plasmid) [Mesorhizobium atlanticum]